MWHQVGAWLDAKGIEIGFADGAESPLSSTVELWVS